MLNASQMQILDDFRKADKIAIAAGCEESPFRGDEEPVDVSEIVRTVAYHASTDHRAIVGPRRGQEIIMPRMVAMLLAYELLPSYSLPRLGRAFHRDHSTIVKNVKTCRGRLADKKRCYDGYRELYRKSKHALGFSRDP